jgi:hypothetical protein
MNKTEIRARRAYYAKIAWSIAWGLLIATIFYFVIKFYLEQDVNNKPISFVIACIIILVAFFAAISQLSENEDG